MIEFKNFRRAWRAVLVTAVAAVAGCGTNGSAPSAGLVDTSSTTAVVTTPPPTTQPTTTVGVDVLSPNGAAGEKDIADNFDISTALEAGPGVPIDNGGDPLGAFRFFCLPGQVLKDDPVALPGQPGASHLHQFIGNTGANANSTYASLRTSGGSTCDNRGQPTALNRSSYWMPAMLDGMGNVVRPDTVLVYYKQLPASSPYCGAPDATHTGYCTALPNGIRFIFGYNMKTMTGGPTDTGSWDYWALTFECTDRSRNQLASVNGVYHTIPEVVAAGCPAGAWLKVGLDAPTCWDGKNLDVADHRSHVVYASGVGVGASGQRACPLDHPYRLPGIAYSWFFNTDANFLAGRWRLSSDDMLAQMTGKPVVAGTTLHMDYFEAWSPIAKARWIQNCINRHLTCSNMELGDGTEGKDGGVPAGGWMVQPLVPAP